MNEYDRQTMMNLAEQVDQLTSLNNTLRQENEMLIAENRGLRDSFIGPMLAAQHVHECLKPESAFPERIP